LSIDEVVDELGAGATRRAIVRRSGDADERHRVAPARRLQQTPVERRGDGEPGHREPQAETVDVALGMKPSDDVADVCTAHPDVVCDLVEAREATFGLAFGEGEDDVSGDRTSVERGHESFLLEMGSRTETAGHRNYARCNLRSCDSASLFLSALENHSAHLDHAAPEAFREALP
jgi:hypothetical protein